MGGTRSVIEGQWEELGSVNILSSKESCFHQKKVIRLLDICSYTDTNDGEKPGTLV